MRDYDAALTDATERPAQLLVAYSEAARLLATSTRSVRRLVALGLLERVALPLGARNRDRGRPKIRLASVLRLVERSVVPAQPRRSKVAAKGHIRVAARTPDLQPGDEPRTDTGPAAARDDVGDDAPDGHVDAAGSGS